MELLNNDSTFNQISIKKHEDKTLLNSGFKKQIPNFTNEFIEYLIENKYSPLTIKNHKYRLAKVCRNLTAISGKPFSSLKDCEHLTKELFLTFEHLLMEQVQNKELIFRTTYSHKKTMTLLYEFLISKKIISFEIKNTEPLMFQEFELYLKNRNYAPSTMEEHKKRLGPILRKLKEISLQTFSTLEDCEQITQELISEFVNFLRKNHSPSSAYSDMKTVRLFLLFLHFKRIVSYKYEIPKDMVVRGGRANVYIEIEQILEFADFIIQNEEDEFSKVQILTLLLLLVDTGCRLIEASNILVTDVYLTERNIKLKSIKSGTRTLKLSPLLINIIKEYLELKQKTNSETPYFFFKKDGSQFPYRELGRLLIEKRKKLNSGNRIFGRALRHTFITNAIDNNNDPFQVAETVGHKHLVSTQHYLHRSINRLLKNTLNHNPIEEIIEIRNDENANRNSKQI